MARSMVLFALALLFALPGLPASAAADQPQAQPGSGAAPKLATAKGKKNKPSGKVPTVTAPAAKPAQPVPPPASAKPPEPKPPDDKADPAKPGDAKAAPHFASLRAEKVFLRSGPSADFPIEWVFVRRGLPVEILATFDIWRKIRDIDGTVGWVNQQMLTGRRSVLVTGGVRDLHGDANAGSEVVAQLETGVVASVSKCDPAWCEVKAGGYKGWLKRDEVWGLEPDEVIQ